MTEQTAVRVSQPLPTSAAVFHLLSGLLGSRVELEKGAPVVPRSNVPTVAALYVRDDGTVVAACISDLALGAHAGAALAMIPANVAVDQIKLGRLEDLVFDNWREILNVFASLFNAADVPHVRLLSVHQAPSDPLPVAAQLVHKPQARLDLEVSIERYGAGRLSLLVG